MTFKIPEKTGQDVPDGTYRASLIGITDKADGSFGDGAYRLWDWLLEVPGQSEPVPYSDTTSQGLGPKTNSYKRLQALLGFAPEPGQEVASPVGKMALVQIHHLDSKGQPSDFPKTAGVFPYVAPATSEGGTPR